MSRNKSHSLVFGAIMSCAMAAGMELYNIGLKVNWELQALARAVFPLGLLEMAGMGALVFIFSNLWGNRCGAALAARAQDPKRRLRLRQLGTVAVMCPTMSLAATVIFALILGRQPMSLLPGLWLTTCLKNLPMALVWSMLVAAPLARWLTGRLLGRPRLPQPGRPA